MITITKNSETNAEISFSIAEDFKLEITIDDETLTENDTLLFEVAKNDTGANIIEKRISALNNSFSVIISDAEKKRLTVGNYIYRMTVKRASLENMTYISGNLRVNWGA